jgi:hypothetical protein
MVEFHNEEKDEDIMTCSFQVSEKCCAEYAEILFI